MNIEITESFRNEIAHKIPDISVEILNKSIEFGKKDILKNGQQYSESIINKISALNYFIDLSQIFNEIRYSTITSECNRELLNSSEATMDEKRELVLRLKYYVDNAVYRYYSFWEIVGRFFNEYFDLRFEIDKNDLTKEKPFYFRREVLNKVIKEFNHPLLIKIFEIWGNSTDIFDYRMIKTHKKNTRVGENILKITKKITSSSRELKIDAGKEYSLNDLSKLLKSTYNNSKLTLEYISEFFDIGHLETKRNGTNIQTQSKIIIPNQKTIDNFSKIIKLIK